MKPDFTPKLMDWNARSNTRQMPWKGQQDPYKIWISEIILQQTRVEQGLNYYNAFVSSFPNIQQLAAAPEEKVFKLWEGLGYYSRCKNMIITAKYISENLNGKFPRSYKDLLTLKGVGPYTAAAIASFAFGLPHAVVDGNVFRVLARYFGIDTPIDSAAGKERFNRLAGDLLYKKNPGAYNQAIMDFGAIICKPRQPLCQQCPLEANCQALAQDRVEELPLKEKKLKKKHRWFYYFVVEGKNGIMIRKRSARDIWENLYEFVLYETDMPLATDEKSVSALLQKLFGNKKLKIKSISPVFSQQLTHQHVHGCFTEINWPANMPVTEGYEAVNPALLKNYPFPRLIKHYQQQRQTS